MNDQPTVNIAADPGWGCRASALCLADLLFCPCVQEVGRRRQPALATANCFFRQKPVAYRTRGKKGDREGAEGPCGGG